MECERTPMQDTEEIWRLADAGKDGFQDLFDCIWHMPELACTEACSCAEHRAMLRQQGFRVTEQVAGIPALMPPTLHTSFARWSRLGLWRRLGQCPGRLFARLGHYRRRVAQTQMQQRFYSRTGSGTTCRRLATRQRPRR